MNRAAPGTGSTGQTRRQPWLLGAAGVLVLAAGLRLALLWGLDLSDLPGPGGVQFLALALDPEPADLPLPALVFRWAIRWLPMSPTGAVRTLVALCSLLSIAGAMAAAWALLGRHAAIITGLLLACWAQHIQQALLLGMDAPACALAWAGLGLAWWGARCKLPGLPMALFGGFLVALGAALKPTALPVLALLLLVPLLAGRPWWRPALASVATALGGLAGHAAVAPFATSAPDVQGSLPAIGDVAAGWMRLLALRQGEPEGALLELMVLGAVAAAAPGKGWVRRVALAVLTAALLGYACHSLGDWLRFRYLVPAALGVFVLAADGLGRAVRWRARLQAVGWALVAVVAALLTLDALAFHQAWSDARVPAVGTAPHRLPTAPVAWSWRYRDLFWDSSLSTQGAAGLMALVRQAPPAGVAVLPLQDGRHAHAEAAAAMAGLPLILLEEQRCCPSGLHAVLCARETVRALDAAGVLVVLLPSGGDPVRIPRESFAWARSLQAAASSALPLQQPDAWWATLQGQGQDGPPPCTGP